MSTPIEARCRALIVALGLGDEASVLEAEPLTGGVASDIARVRLEDGRDICVKFALPKLKVAADWRAPVHRNAAEYAWLQAMAEAAPESAVRLYGCSEAQHGFAMEFLSGDDVYLWKAALLAEAPDQGEAAKVGGMLGRLHAASRREGFDAGPFQNRDDFRALRIEPYLTFTASRHPALADRLNALAEMLYESAQVLIHGDVSPKNILFRGGLPVILDAECATMGDASFDPAFCLNHLVLKAAHLPASRDRLLADVLTFWRAYSPSINWEAAEALEARVSRLLAALMLARVDGKSPVEYLYEPARGRVRAIASALVLDPPPTLAAFVDRVEARLKEQA